MESYEYHLNRNSRIFYYTLLNGIIRGQLKTVINYFKNALDNEDNIMYNSAIIFEYIIPSLKDDLNETELQSLLKCCPELVGYFI